MIINEYILKLLNNYKKETYERGNILFYNHQKCEKIGIVLKGEVKISTITYLEKEEIISFISENEIFGNTLIFSSHPYYLGDVIVEKKAEIIFLTKKELLDLFKQDSIFFELYLNEICDKTIKVKKQNKLLAHKNIKDRILFYFNNLSNITHNKTIKLPSITKLANELSLPRPSVSRELTNLEKEGLILRKQKEITLLY